MFVKTCWYCGSGSWTGDLVEQPDGKLLHQDCIRLARLVYPHRPICDPERTDAKVAWRDEWMREREAKC